MRGWSLSLVLFLAIAAPAFAEVQTVGDVSFAVPEGWTYQGSADGGLMVLKQDQNFWIISVHAPQPTSGNQSLDFKNAWRSVVLTVPGFQNSLPGYDPYDINKKVLGYPGKYYDGSSANGQMQARLYTLETGKVVMGRAGLGRPLVGGTGNPEPPRKAVQLVDLIGEQVAPFQTLPVPDGVVDIDHGGLSRNCRGGASPA